MNIVRSCQNTSAAKKYDTVQNVSCSFKQSSSIRNLFHFFLAKSAIQNYFHNVSALLLLRNVVRVTRTTFFASLFSLEVKLLWRNAFARE